MLVQKQEPTRLIKDEKVFMFGQKCATGACKVPRAFVVTEEFAYGYLAGLGIEYAVNAVQFVMGHLDAVRDTYPPMTASPDYRIGYSAGVDRQERESISAKSHNYGPFSSGYF